MAALQMTRGRIGPSTQKEFQSCQVVETQITSLHSFRAKANFRARVKPRCKHRAKARVKTRVRAKAKISPSPVKT